MDLFKLRRQAALEPRARDLLNNELWDEIRAQLERTGVEALLEAKPEEVEFWQAFVKVNRQYQSYIRACLTTGEDAAKQLASKHAKQHRR